VYLARVLCFGGRSEEAIPSLKKAIRLNPFPHSYYFQFLGNAYRTAGRHEEAIRTGKRAVQITPIDLLAHLNLAAVYSLASWEEEARTEAVEVLWIDPRFSLEYCAKHIRYRNQADKEQHIETLPKEGRTEMRAWQKSMILARVET
jgi:tetratricopeptide (TPR) repeat protein